MVLVDHSAIFFGVPNRWCAPLGRIGVLIFFVHTCLVLLLSLERQRERSASGLAWRFLVRRAFRIYPLAAVTVLPITVFAIPSAGVNGARAIGYFGRPSVGTLVSNLALAMNLTGHRPILGPLWSLPIEVQMYACLPALFLLARRLRTRHMVALWLVAVVVASIQLFAGVGLGRAALLQYVPHFLGGAVAFVGLTRRPRLSSAAWVPAIVTICSVAYVMNTAASYWVMCLAIGFLIPHVQQIVWPPLVAAAHQIARYSYGVYLWHVPALWLAFVGLSAPFGVQIAAWLALLVILPFVSFHVIEQPLIRTGIWLAQPAKPQPISVPATV